MSGRSLGSESRTFGAGVVDHPLSFMGAMLSFELRVLGSCLSLQCCVTPNVKLEFFNKVMLDPFCSTFFFFAFFLNC